VQQQRTILLAEPDTALRAQWSGQLAAMGFRVLETGDGASALKMALRSEVNLLITELYLDTNDDRCLVHAARQEPGLRRVKILVVTEHGRILQVSARLAASRQQSRAEVRAAGATHAN